MTDPCRRIIAVMYSLFGIIPSFVYTFGVGISDIDLILDVLNICVKVPIAICLAYGLTNSPRGYQTC